MKISILVPDLALGGGQRVAVNTAELLAIRHNVSLVIFTEEEKFFDTNVNIINLECSKQSSLTDKLKNIYKRVKCYKALLKKEQFDITISFLESANLCAFLSDRKNSILTLHTKPELLTQFDQLILYYLFRFSHHLIAVSDGLKETLESTQGLKHISVINNSIDITKVQTLSDTNTYTHRRKFMVSVGRLVEVKRYDLMIDAFLKSKASNNYDLVIIGGGEDYHDLKKHLESYPSSDVEKVHLIGEMENPFPLIKAAELFLMTSRIEAFPMVLLESLALKTPIVSYNCPAGLKDIVLHNKNGLLVKNNDFEGFISAIDQASMDNNLRKKFVSNTLESVERFTPESILIDWENYMQQMIIQSLNQ